MPPHFFAAIPGAPGVGSSVKTRLSKQSDLKGTILLTGDSVITAKTKEDSDGRTLFSMLEERLAFPVKDISNSAYDQRVFHSQLVALKSGNKTPKLVLVAINLRSFSPKWETNPYIQRKAVINFNHFPYDSALYRAWKIIDPDKESASVQEEWDRKTSEEPEASAPIAQGFRDAYCYTLDDSLGLEQLTKSLKIREGLPFEVVFYLTPINFQMAKENLPSSDLKKLEQNLEQLRQLLNNSGVVWEDYSKSLGPEHFYHSPLQPDEHLRASGRIWLAEKLEGLASETFAKGRAY